MDDFSTQTPSQILEGITAKHPAAYFYLSALLMNEGNLDDATMWFYTGQIRYRAYLIANPELDPSGDPALFGSLMDALGTPVNEYAGGDIDFWIASIDKALNWHHENDDIFLDKLQNQDVYKDVTSQLIEMRDEISTSQAEIREQRVANGLENR